MSDIQTEGALADVLMERARQDAKWGEQNHDLMTWMAILGEEYGEACQAALHDTYGGKAVGTFYQEVVHTTAVGLQILEFLRRSRYGILLKEKEAANGR